MDEIDRRILSDLSQNCRQRLSDLSAGMKLSRDRVKYRVKKLEDDGVITKYAASINPYKFGLCLYKTYVRLDNDKARIEKLVNYLDKHPRAYWVAECYGRWDLMFATFAYSPKEFHTIQDEVLAKFSDIVLSFEVYVLIDVWYFSRSYLSGFDIDQFFFGGTPENHAISELDLEIMKLLTKDARLTVVDIANQVNSSTTTVRYRIERLENLGVIAGYRVELDLSKIGMNFFKAQLHLSSYDPRKEQELREFCRTNPYVLHFIQQIGDCKIELELEVKDFDQYNSVVDQMRQKFKKYIRNIEVIVIKKQRFKGVPFDIGYIEH